MSAANSGSASVVMALPNPETTLALHTRTYAGERHTPPGDHLPDRGSVSYGVPSSGLGGVDGQAVRQWTCSAPAIDNQEFIAVATDGGYFQLRALDSQKRLPYYVEQACRRALHGRPGPTYLELPAEVIRLTRDDL